MEYNTRIAVSKKPKSVERPTVDLKLVLSGTLYILQTNAQWRNLPKYYGKRSTVHGLFMRWTRSGVFKTILNYQKWKHSSGFDFQEVFIDTNSIKASLARFSGKSFIDHAKRGVKKGVIIDINLIFLSTLVDAANRRDSKLLEPQLANLEPFVKENHLFWFLIRHGILDRYAVRLPQKTSLCTLLRTFAAI